MTVRRVRAGVVEAERPERQRVDYRALFAEGAQVTVQGFPVSLIVEPYGDGTHAVVLPLVLVPLDKAEMIAIHGRAALDLMKRAPSVSLAGLLSVLTTLMGGSR